MRNAIFLLAVTGFLAMTAPAAIAQDSPPDYVFDVPVRIENAPHLVNPSVFVTCTVRAMDAAGGLLAGPLNSAAVPLAEGGNYRGTVRVELRLPAGIARSDVRDWTCRLIINVARDPSGAVVLLPPGAAAYTTVTGQTIVSSVLTTGGAFSR